MSNQDQEHDFENEVRRIARAKWTSAQYSGAEMRDGRERDGIFETEESIHFVEATVSQSASKAKEDSKKIFKAISDYNASGKSLKGAVGWFVTKHEPTADQRTEVKTHGKGQVRAVSMSQFQQSLVDVREYLAARNNHIFGSVTDLRSGSRIPSTKFIEPTIFDRKSNTTYRVPELSKQLLSGRHFAIEGQYGAGKSMTMREIFLYLANQYIYGKSMNFPIYLNLREHTGQKDPVEILERHARNIGFPSPASLVRAWRAGFAVVLADGFDEVASLGVQGAWKRLRDIRRRALEGIRALIKQSEGIGVLVCGRNSYLEDNIELPSALGLNHPTVLSIEEFSEDQARDFLSQFSIGTTSELPSWLPNRPLILGTLASRGILADLEGLTSVPDAVDGWDYLLERIYQREANIETNLDGLTLRTILERLATVARSTEDGLGPIPRSALFSAFQDVCGYEADEQGILAIQRLPGLGIYRAEDESRAFVDKELVGVCNGRELWRFIENPFEQAKSALWAEAMSNCDKSISNISRQYVTRKIQDNSGSSGFVRQTITFLNRRSDLKCTRGDMAAILLAMNFPAEEAFSVSGIDYSIEIEFDEDIADVSNISFSNCIFDKIYLGANTPKAHLPTFSNCLIDSISGRLSIHDLPSDRFLESCEVFKFDDSGTSDAIRGAQISAGERVLLIALRKLFVQSLSGRLESAFFRGLDVDERRLVPDVLRLLRRHSLVVEYSRGNGLVLLPAKKALSRVTRILSAPSECGEAIVSEARKLV